MAFLSSLTLVIASLFFTTPAIAGSTESAVRLPDLLPTMYYVADEDQTSCTGRYRSIDYDGTERTDILNPSGEVIANVCTRFYKVLGMEGTGVLSDRGQGKLLVNWAGKWRFKVLKKCIYGLGVQGRCLLPYHTIAADLKQYPVGTIIRIERAKGLILPDGTAHNGLFIVRDTGGAFRGVGQKRVDLFVGFEKDLNNVFSRAGFHHRKGEEAYRLTDEEREEAIEFFKEKFPVLFSVREYVQ